MEIELVPGGKTVVEIIDGSGYVVAFVPTHSGSSQQGEAEQRLHLILAAPRLLQAVRTALEFFWNPTSFHVPSIERLYESVIRKAEGKST